MDHHEEMNAFVVVLVEGALLGLHLKLLDASNRLHVALLKQNWLQMIQGLVECLRIDVILVHHLFLHLADCLRILVGLLRLTSKLNNVKSLKVGAQN